MYEGKVDKDTFDAQNVYDKAHASAKRAGLSDSEAHNHASKVMKKLFPNHTASSSGEGQVYKNVNEAKYSAEAGHKGEDLGKPGKNFEKIAKSAGKKYGSEEAGKRVVKEVIKKQLEKTKFVKKLKGKAQNIQQKVKTKIVSKTKEIPKKLSSVSKKLSLPSNEIVPAVTTTYN